MALLSWAKKSDVELTVVTEKQMTWEDEELLTAYYCINHNLHLPIELSESMEPMAAS
ncbi:hypothetical protein SAMN05192559_102444 [Halobacillus karajensis]|nr:hypothetical protein [Halobacillus karajensis]SEH64355.1 hypothetical protein SAMN05192559_102444 [Halobacillus karajensis]